MINIYYLINKFAQYSQKEQEKLLSKWYEKEDYYVEIDNDIAHLSIDDLNNWGIYPIQRPSEKLTSRLGGGVFSNVFEALYKGKRVAIKITFSKQDAFAMDRLYEIAKDDPEVSKNIAKIFDIKSTELTTMSGNDKTVYIIITEFLNPLPSNIISDLFSSKSHETLSFRTESIIENKQKLFDILRNSLTDIPEDKIKKKTDKIIERFTKQADNVENKFVLLMQLINEAFEKYRNDENYNILMSNIDGEIRRSFPEQMFDSYYTTSGSYTNDSYAKTTLNAYLAHPNKHIKDLANTLLILYNKYNIAHCDLHKNNIMVRPSTGDLVISDPGLFEF